MTFGALLAAVITVLGVLQLWPPGDPTDASGPGPTDPEITPEVELTGLEVTNRFLNALSVGDAAGAGALTDDEPAATAQLAEVWRTMRPSSVTADRTALVDPAPDATSADERFTLTWNLGGPRSWAYESVLRLVRNDAGWRVHWQPTLVHPRLGAGQSLAVRDATGQPAVLDRDGTPLLLWNGTGTAPADPPLAPVLLPAMGRDAAARGGADGWRVALVDAAGTELEVLRGSPATPHAATLSVPVQRAAQAAVDSQQLPTTMVVIQPSTGGILAVAQNNTAGLQPVALTGMYPPGSTFKIATATALVGAGVADVDTVVPCPGSATVEQRTVRNSDSFALGDVSLRTAFAASCNTTFAMQAAELPADALPGAAAQLGLGADYDIPGITTVTGRVPPSANTAEQVENSYGQGRVELTCFGAAMMSTTVAAGRAVTPRLWRDVETTVNVGYEAPPAGVIGSLRTMMRAVVTSGTAEALGRYGNVFGKTGTAQVGDGTNAHGWFTGYRGDLAFATFVQDAQTSAVAVAVTGTFLGALG